MGHTLAEGLPGRGFPSGSSPRTQHPQPSEVSDGGRQRLGGCTDPEAVGQSGLEPHSRPDKSSEPQDDRDSAAAFSLLSLSPPFRTRSPVRTSSSAGGQDTRAFRLMYMTTKSTKRFL